VPRAVLPWNAPARHNPDKVAPPSATLPPPKWRRRQPDPAPAPPPAPVAPPPPTPAAPSAPPAPDVPEISEPAQPAQQTSAVGPLALLLLQGLATVLITIATRKKD